MWDVCSILIFMRTHIWIRKENEEKWEAVADKSDWVNRKISEDDAIIISASMGPTPVARSKEITLGGKDVTEKVQLGLERACCLANKPCQHWSFTGDHWLNSLSGRVKEID